MIPPANLDLLKHQSAKYHLPTTDERDAAQLQKKPLLAIWRFVSPLRSQKYDLIPEFDRA